MGKKGGSDHIKLSDKAFVPCAYVVINGSFWVRNLQCQPLQETESLQLKIFQRKHHNYLQF